MKQRTIFVGDIHGHFDELQDLLKLSEWNSNTDRLIILGDLCDRGPKSVETVKWAKENSVEVIRGNHDQRYLDIQAKEAWHNSNPGNQIPNLLKSVEKMKIYRELSPSDLRWISQMPHMIEFPDLNMIAVHAGFKPGLIPEQNSFNTMMHIRFLYDGHVPAHLDKKDFSAPPGSYFWADFYTDKRNVIYGHHVWSKKDVKIHRNASGALCYGIDTGCCFKGHLTALAFDNSEGTASVPKTFQVSHKM